MLQDIWIHFSTQCYKKFYSKVHIIKSWFLSIKIFNPWENIPKNDAIETIWSQKILDYRLKCPLTLLAAYSAVFRKLIWESFYTRAQEKKNAHKIERKRKNNIYSAAVHAGWPHCHAAECTVCLELWSTYLHWKSLFISKTLKTLGEKVHYFL